MQSEKLDGLHVGIIMDGNGRWATRRGLPRAAGHRAGVAAVRRAVACAPELGIRALTVYAFSADNWRRPSGEVQTIFWLLRAYLRLEREKLRKRGAQLKAIGRRDRIPPMLLREIEETEAATAQCDRLQLRVAIDYSAREAIAMAVARMVESELRLAGSEMRSSHPMSSAAADGNGWGTPVGFCSGAKAPTGFGAENVRPEGRTLHKIAGFDVRAKARTLHDSDATMPQSHPMSSARADDTGWGTPVGFGAQNVRPRGRTLPGADSPRAEARLEFMKKGLGPAVGAEAATYQSCLDTCPPEVRRSATAETGSTYVPDLSAIRSVDALRPMVTEALTADCGEVDLLIRTGGEKRLSDFLLWESAYAELYFTDRMWPEFDRADLEAAVAEFHHRQRRFGGVPVAEVAARALTAGGVR